jgi:hypothetical protein
MASLSLILALWLVERSLGIGGLAVVFAIGFHLGEPAWAGILGVLAASSFQTGSAVWVRDHPVAPPSSTTHPASSAWIRVAISSLISV